MIAIVRIQRNRGMNGWAIALWTTALLAASLAVAVALYASSLNGAAAVPALTAAEEAAARQARIAFFEARAAADPLDFLSLNVLAGQYLQRARETGDVADYQRAEAAATRSLELVPRDNYGGLINLASVRLAQHDFSAVALLALDAMKLKPYKAAPYALLSDAQVGQGLYDDASDSLVTMLQIDAGLPALSRLAHLAFLRGDRFNAIDFWRQAIDRGQSLPLENQAWAHVQLGVMYFAFGRLSDAASELEKALELYPEYVHGLAGLGQVRGAQQRYDEAIDLYTRAVSRLPQPRYVAALGDVYAAAGREAEAAQQYALVEAIAGLYREAGINIDLQIATYYADHDVELPRALEMARAAYEAAPGVYAADSLAWALYKDGQLEAAARYAATATAWATPEPSFYFHAALIHTALGNQTASAEHLQRLSDLNLRFNPLLAAEVARLLTESEASR